MGLSLEKKDHRLQFRFWLDVIRPEEESLAEYVEDLKVRRSFAQTIRDALRLIRDLQAGRLFVLLSLFPWVEDYFRERFANATPAPQPDWLHGQLEQLRELLQQRPMLPSGDSPALPESRPIAKLPAANNINNIDLEIKKTSKPVNAGRILILQVWLTSSEKNIELFKAEDLEMVTGHPAFNQSLIKAEIARRKKAAQFTPQPAAEKPVIAEPPPATTGNSKQLKGAEIEFAAPDFEELDLL